MISPLSLYIRSPIFRDMQGTSETLHALGTDSYICQIFADAHLKLNHHKLRIILIDYFSLKKKEGSKLLNKTQKDGDGSIKHVSRQIVLVKGPFAVRVNQLTGCLICVWG